MNNYVTTTPTSVIEQPTGYVTLTAPRTDIAGGYVSNVAPRDVVGGYADCDADTSSGDEFVLAS